MDEDVARQLLGKYDKCSLQMVMYFSSIIKVNAYVGARNCVNKVLDDCLEKIKPFIIRKFGDQNKSTVAELFKSFFNQVCFLYLCMHGSLSVELFFLLIFGLYPLFYLCCVWNS